MGSASNISASEMVVCHPAVADGDVAHLTVEHGEGRWRMLDEYLQSFLALAQGPFCSFPLDSLSDGSRDSGESFDRVLGQWVARKHRHHPDDAILNQKRVARECRQSLFSRPHRIADARVIFQ